MLVEVESHSKTISNSAHSSDEQVFSSEGENEDFSFPKVELHVHLDGAVRHATLLELAQCKGKKGDLLFDQAKTVDDVRDLLITNQPSDLVKVLSSFDLYLPYLVGDAEAIERIAYELCEDEARDNVIYFEARFAPHLLCNTANISRADGPHSERNQGESKQEDCVNDSDCPHPQLESSSLDARGVVEAALRGLARGELDFGVKARCILCCLYGYPEWNEEVLDLASKLIRSSAVRYKDSGVVGIDVAGVSEDYEPSVIQCFREAVRLGINRTVHAGESSGAASVVRAVELLGAQRIGHGYHIVDDEAAYRKYALPGHIHFEMCPLSSVICGSAKEGWEVHAIARCAADMTVNFSLNTDDPTCFGNSMCSEMLLAHRKIGLTTQQIKQCQLNAARSCFLPKNERETLIKQLECAFNEKDD